jgi:hypothetical protein
MPKHWEWAMDQALDDPRITHVAYLSDRMLFKKGALRKFTSVIAAHPNRLISYNIDSVMDWDYPIKIRRETWTGKVLAIDTAELGALSGRSVFPPCLPRMVNCVAPRSLLESMRARFSNLFSSIAPDYYFAYLYLAHEERLAFLDESLLVHYALHRSNGHSMAQGLMSDDYRDFIENLGGTFVLRGMPLPDLLTGGNVMLNEYCIVREQTHSPKLPAIDHQAYLNYLLLDVGNLKDAEARERARSFLLQLGAGSGQPEPPEPYDLENRSFPRKVIDKIKWELRRVRVLRSLVRTLRPVPIEDEKLDFETTDAALAYLLHHPRKRSRDFSGHPFKSFPLEADARNGSYRH